jgi:ATP-binding cassette subfamily B protein
VFNKISSKAKTALQLKRAINLVWQSGPRWTMASIALILVQGLLPLLALYLLGRIVDAVAVGVTAPDKTAAFWHVAWLVGFAGATALAIALFASLSALVSEGQSLAVTDHMHGVLHAKAVEVDIEYYENPEYHNKFHRAQTEAPYRPTRIVQGLTNLCQNLVSLVGIGVLLFSLHWGIIAVLLIAAIPGVLVRFHFINVMFVWQRESTLTERKAAYFNWMLTMAYWAKELRLFNMSPEFTARFRQLRAKIRHERLAIAVRRMMSDMGTQVFAVLPMFACFAYIAYEAIQGNISAGNLVMYFQLFQRGQSSLQGVLGALLGLHEDNMFLSNLYEFLDLKPKVADPAQPKPVPRPMSKGIEFKNVSFEYALSTRQAIKDVNLHVKPGEVIALVGENGSGKTTLIKLLCRMYDPTSGSISIDGTDIREFKADDLRREISVIFQDYVQYDLTARENIWVGNMDLPLDDERIVEAARRSGADSVIKTLPHGYDTVLGRVFENSEELSIGQWQKVAIARAFLRESQVIILDEPTSALDPQAEFEVFEKFRQLIKDQAAILISHRLSTVKMADRICVMQDGKIAEIGTHRELMSNGGVYSHLFDIQAEAYK